ncbi:efflux RND transporter periplasmic adaptor subunit [Chitinimonas sp. BJB300]|uniref:efflux RND transporter periplasmic adaptor subunit n=1 Tax=Chitinimonas sp. BJB300 TaxID=1559339 RepID=UPI000C0FC241|nr:efflux RND transporter periplasmic adaptor subunit [Chitinimonas sp. BJB300]PHV13074.1 efflux transporter periplasmic adaptor subunit [Chitinimonas sp. BJB300]TSJ87716.1 efflux RND transporter periplasmic adaptor subunit [Chitinimonas sp. BJB300]
MSRRPVFYLVGVSLAALIAYAAFKPAVSGDKNSGAGDRPSQISSVLSQADDVTLQVEAQGTVTALNTVELRPQVSSTVREVHIKEGQEVRAGQLLFSLDTRADAAKVAQTAAELTQEKAKLADAERSLKRTRELMGQGFVSQSALDTAQTTLDSSRASVAAKQASLEATRVGLAYQTLTAPLSGRTGAIDIHPGSLVQPSMAAPLVTLTQTDPIAVAFTLPERELNRLLALQAAGPAEAAVQLGNERIVGKLSFIDNTVNSESGTVRLKAEFPNTKHLLWPGAFVRITLNLGVEKNAVILPSSALQTGPKGQFVYVVEPDQTVKMLPVQLKRVITREGKQFAVIDGLPGGRKVVAEGGQNLRPGAKVSEGSNEKLAKS